MLRRLAVLLSLYLTGLTDGAADWAGFSRFPVLAELQIGAGEVHLNLRIRADAADSIGALLGSPGADQTLKPDGWLPQLIQLSSPDRGASAARLVSYQHHPATPSTPDGPAIEAYYEAELSFGDGWVERDSTPAGEPPRADEGNAHRPTLSLIPANRPGLPGIGLMVLHRGVPVADLTALQRPEAVLLDPSDPWRTHFVNSDIARRHSAPRSYLYVEPYEVRHEVLIRLADLLRLQSKASTPPPTRFATSEQPALLARLGETLLRNNPLNVDGVDVSGEIDRIQFVRFSRDGIQPVSAAEAVEVEEAMVGAVLVYLTEQPAKAVSLTWTLFDDGLTQRPVQLIRGRESFDADLNIAAPVFEWSQDESLEPALPAQASEPPERVHEAPSFRPASSSEWRWAAAVILLALALLIDHMFTQGRTHRRLLIGVPIVAALGFLGWELLTHRSAERPLPGGFDDATAAALLHPLLHNTYRAFQLRGEEQTYDRLAKSLSGALLDDIYLQQRRSVLRQRAGLGGEGRVDRVEVLETRVAADARWPDRVELMAKWRAHGTVSHWGHSHERHNAYQARLRLTPGEGGQWRIVGLEFVDGQRLDRATGG